MCVYTHTEKYSKRQVPIEMGCQSTGKEGDKGKERQGDWDWERQIHTQSWEDKETENGRETEKGKETEIHAGKENKPFKQKEPSGFSVLPKKCWESECVVLGFTAKN